MSPPTLLVDEAEVAADAVLDVDDEVADAERAEVLDERARGVAASLSRARAVRAAAEDLLLGDDRRSLRRAG